MKIHLSIFRILLLAGWCFFQHGDAGEGQSTPATCSPLCRCEDGGADCSGRGLTAVPTGLSAFTYYLDISMNNITELPANVFRNLPYLEELRLAGNDLSFIHPDALSGLHQLKVLMLQNNQLRTVPSAALRNLNALQSLRLDANHITVVPEDSFEGLQQLRHLWLDDNSLTEVPIGPLRHQGNLQALTLALNRIEHIPDHAFANLSSLVVLHLHNNRIQDIGENCFSGLENLETLDLNFNSLTTFPEAIQTLPKLKELGFHSNNIAVIPEGAFHKNPLLRAIHLFDNPLSFVGVTAFQNLSDLSSLMLRGASLMKDFPSLTGTVNLESLTLTGTKISSIPNDLCDDLSLLRTLDLSYNQIQTLPSLQGCVKLQEISLQHNHLQQVDRDTFHGLDSLRVLDLSQNQIKSIHRDGFLSLNGLTNLDLSQNALSSVPTVGLSALTQLKLSGNLHMKQPLSAQNLPKLRSILVPYAYQCCAFIGCDTPPIAPQHTADTKRAAGGEEDVERVSLVMHCSPSPGAFKPCDHLLGSWMIRLTVWFICIVALVFNSLVLVVTFSRRSDRSMGGMNIRGGWPPLSSARLLVGLLALANLLTGVYTAALVGVDAWAWGAFAHVGVWWESSAACGALGALAVFSAEWAVLLLLLAAVERSLAVRVLLAKQPINGGGSGHRGSRGCNVRRRMGWASALLALMAAVAGLLTLLPGNSGMAANEEGVSSSTSISAYAAASPLCLPFSAAAAAEHDGRWLGMTVSLTLLNALAYLLMAGVYTRLYCGLGGARLLDGGQAAAVRHVAWLIFTNCIFFCPVAAFSFSPLLAAAGTTAGPDIAKSVLLIFFPLPACLNPVLYAFFSPAFREDWLHLRGRGQSINVSNATATGVCCGASRAGAKWASTGTATGLVGGIGCQGQLGALEGRVAVTEEEEEDEDATSQAGRGYSSGYRQLGTGPTVMCQHCCQVALLARNSLSSASPSTSSSSSSASGCRHLVKSHSCPTLAPGHTSAGHMHTHNHHQHASHGLPLRPEGLWESGTPSAQSEYADEGDSLVSDSSEQVQACGRACFCHSRGLPLVHYTYNPPRIKD